MPHFAIKLVEGKTEDQKKQLAAAVVKAAKDVIGYNDDAFSVTIEDVSRETWFSSVYPKDIIAKKEILYKEPGY